LSLKIERPVGDWDSMIAAMSEDRLLLQEAAHRTANELSAALAALNLIKPAKGSRARWRLLSAAMERLEGFATVNRVLALPTGVPVMLSQEIECLCAGLGAARCSIGDSRIVLDVGDFAVNGSTARRVLLIAAELVHNGIRHALEGRTGKLTVALRLDKRDVMLGVLDDGPGIVSAAASRGNGMGNVIVSELVRRAGGVIECSTGPGGTAFHVAIPHGTYVESVDDDE